MTFIPVEDDGTGTTGIEAPRRRKLAPPPAQYFETLHAAVEAWYNRLVLVAVHTRKGVPELNLQDFAEQFQPMSYETSQTRKCAILKDGKQTSSIVMSLYRMPSGRYEVTAYLS